MCCCAPQDEQQTLASKFREEFLKTHPLAEKTESGLIYHELVQGTGSQPVRSSTVTVHYTGKLPDGTVFDSSVERGEPASFPLGNVIVSQHLLSGSLP